MGVSGTPLPLAGVLETSGATALAATEDVPPQRRAAELADADRMHPLLLVRHSRRPGCACSPWFVSLSPAAVAVGTRDGGDVTGHGNTGADMPLKHLEPQDARVV